MFRMKTLKFFHILFLSLSTLFCNAQDAQYSQYYNAPTYLNPAFAGTGANTRGIVNYRSQWPGVSSSTPFSTYSVSLDHQIEPYNSGVGLLITRDRIGNNMSVTDVGLLYSYQVDFNEKLSFRPGLQASIVNRNTDYSQLVFGDQLNVNGNTGTATNDELFSTTPINKLYPDFAAGGLFFSNLFWVGASAHHLSTPNIASNNISTPSNLPMKLSFQAGMRISLESSKVKQGYKTISRERSIFPSINFKKQGNFNQLDIGGYAILEPMMFGITYRGIPFQSYEGFVNNESLIFMLGTHFYGFSFAYSFDIVLSQLTLANSGGAHEISLMYEWDIPYPKSKKQRPLPCPRFHKADSRPKR